MVPSFSRVRVGAAALLFVGASACGDDSGGEPTPGKDSGTPITTKDGGLDGGGNALLDAKVQDAAPNVNADASADELAAALDESGIHGGLARAQLVFPAACKKGGQCGTLDTGDTVETCTAGGIQSFNEGLSIGVSVDCQDALLDFLACTVRVSCAMNEADCVDQLNRQMTACAPWSNSDGGL